MTASACSVDRLGRVRTQVMFYICAGVAVVMMGSPDLPVSAILLSAMVGRITIMAASVGYIIVDHQY